MKLQLTLPAKPGFLHTLPALDVIALVLVFPLLGPSFVQQTGIEVKLHESTWRYEQMENPIVITLGAGQNRPLWVNKKRIPIAKLEEEVKRLRNEEGGESITTAVLKSDVSVPSGVEKEIIDRIKTMGLNCGLLYKPVVNK
ncbi:MAG: hypothetical protein HN759_03695 [Akkermansiaceae bacterium]|jgi:biopolymer transport protein ExbD|nr:hypothetical protein [Akkermansiaceae bacterium]